MKSDLNHDFTEGSISKKMMLYSWPIFFGNLLQTSYQFIDSLWVGNLLGANALGAITISATVIFTILSFIIGINGATLTVLSQYKGAKDEKGLKKSLNTFVFVLGCMTLAVGILGFFLSERILTLMGTPADILPMAKAYLQINFIGIIFLFGYNFIGTVLRALGDSKTPIRFVFIAVLLNAVLDPIFISVFNLGIEGAAIATVLSQGTAFVYGILYSIIKIKVPFTVPKLPEKRYFMTLLKLGLPSGLSMMAISAGIMAIMTVVTTYGEEVVAGFGAAQRIDGIIMLPALTLGSAVTSMAGQNIGAKQWERVSEIAKNAMLLIMVVSLTISTAVFFSAEHLIRLFISNEETVAFGTLYLKVIAFFYPFLGINFVLNGIVRASGAMFQVLVLNIISFWVLRYPLTYICANWFGEIGIAIGMGLSFVVSSAVATAYYFFGNWRKIEVIKEEKKQEGE
ncbi:MATE family efflux transporter [Desertibacillus haloalkaliphilus]|uniref:MATE family efflux transporter n=1 Tax=Desertibacillus haloalkaliphilus TaxID=1328930 RepID=UPI001C25A0AB|nr:MATE family efflux transporter [Desertibacillus haloalkaliphilus]MBU8908899.1 MATE family efflux transporter [Desertibacillus haloalkaliphilus]